MPGDVFITCFCGCLGLSPVRGRLKALIDIAGFAVIVLWEVGKAEVGQARGYLAIAGSILLPRRAATLLRSPRRNGFSPPYGLISSLEETSDRVTGPGIRVSFIEGLRIAPWVTQRMRRTGTGAGCSGRFTEWDERKQMRTGRRIMG